jgi:hypothetical protein
MSNESFEIRPKRFYDRTVYRATVEITNRSESVVRFTIRAGEKEIQMEKLLFRKTNQWKIKGMSFTMKGDPKVNARLIMDIQDAIDYQMKKLYP